MAIDDGRENKSPEERLSTPDLQDIFAVPYPTGAISAPPLNADPGRARPDAFFDRMYGNCRNGDVQKNLVEVAWMPLRGRTTLKVTRVNGVAEKLRAVSAELELLPPSFDRYLMPGYRRNRKAFDTWIRDCDRSGTEARALLALVATGRNWCLFLAERHPRGDRPGVRKARIHLGRALVSLRHHALRIPA
jgi:hypothetical protein